jgi:tetratricopeptide (TPR) repeat protein
VLQENREADVCALRGFAKNANADFDGAIADLTKAIELNPDNTLAYRARGLAKRAKNNLYGEHEDSARNVSREKGFRPGFSTSS